jgi:hypothetical protein
VPGWRRSGSGSTVRDAYASISSTGLDNDHKTVVLTTDADAHPEYAKSKRSQTFHERSSNTVIDTTDVFVRRLAEIGLLPRNPTVFVGKRIRNATAQSYLRHRFIPHNRINELVTEDAVQFELTKANLSMTKISRVMKPRVSADECTSYRKILAILHLMRRSSKIRLFVKERVCDSHLPLMEASCPAGPGKCYELRSGRVPGSSIRFKKRADAKEFLERQWSVLAPFFQGSDGTYIPHNDFESEVILPFLSYEETAKEGGYGKVFKVKIHPDHHSLKREKVRYMRFQSYILTC